MEQRMNPDILIPTCKDDYELSMVIGGIIQENHDANIAYSCLQDSASVNRNKCLDLATSEIVVMIDDDISGFFPRWHKKLIKPLEDDGNIIMVSARLMNEDGTPQRVMGFSDKFYPEVVEIPTCPSAAIAFRNDKMRFDEGYVGSGFEDSDFVRQLKGKYPEGKIVVNNAVRLIHKNEMKNQLGEAYEANRKYYIKKWGSEW
jgi:glycosyltransferase involved in cell wall biosynthesis